MDSDIPDLEDLSDIIKIAKDKQQLHQSKSSTRIASVIGNDKPIANTEFGGMKKGFLSHGVADCKPVKRDSIPFLKANPGKAKEHLVFEEIRDNRTEGWLTDDLVNSVSADAQLTAWLSDPRSAVILSDFQTDPQRAIVKYKDDKETREMLTKFGHLLGGHLSKLASDEMAQDSPSDIIIPGREPKRAPAIKSVVDNQVDKALATDGVRTALLDPAIQRIINCLRSDPEVAQRLIKEADRETHGKLRLLVETGVLGMQQQ